MRRRPAGQGERKGRRMRARLFARGRRPLGGGLALLLWLVAVAPAAAHDTAFSGDPNHLVQDLLVSFGMPLVVLLVGALIGVGLATWMSRGQNTDEQPAEDEQPADEPAEPVWQNDR